MRERRWMLAVGVLALIMGFAGEASADHKPRIIVEGFEAHHATMSLQIHGAGMSISDDLLDIDGVARVGGVGFSWRWDLAGWGGIEAFTSGLSRRSEEGFVDESRSLGSLSWLWYFAQHSRHRFYGITGLAVLATDIDYGGTQYSYSESGLLLGVGSEWMLGRSWVASFDVRGVLLSNDSVDEKPQGEAGWLSPPPDRQALMFNMGFGYRW